MKRLFVVITEWWKVDDKSLSHAALQYWNKSFYNEHPWPIKYPHEKQENFFIIN